MQGALLLMSSYSQYSPIMCDLNANLSACLFCGNEWRKNYILWPITEDKDKKKILEKSDSGETETIKSNMNSQ